MNDNSEWIEFCKKCIGTELCLANNLGKSCSHFIENSCRCEFNKNRVAKAVKESEVKHETN